MLIIVTSTYFACKKGVLEANNETYNTHESSIQSNSVTNSQTHYLFSNEVTSEVVLNNTSTLVTAYKSSNDYLQLPQNIQNQVNNRNPTQINYDSAKIHVMIYTLNKPNSSFTYNTLAVYEYQNKFLSLIVKNEKLANGFAHISFTNLSGNVYFDFQVNLQNMVGKINFTSNILFEKIAPRTGTQRAEPTCMQSTSTFSDCLSCAISECVSDWVCGLACGLESPSCLTVWTVACAID